MKRQSVYVLLVVTVVIVVSVGAAFAAFSYIMKAETNVRYVGLQNMISVKIAKTDGDQCQECVRRGGQTP